MSAMNRPDFSEENDVVAWLILGYLCSHPDAKDTVEGVGSWWLNGEGIDVEAEVVRGSLDYLVNLGWLTAIKRHADVTVYGLNQNRRHVLQRFL
ncbi:MAG TPA: hypothetical protein VF905_09040, partial [Nitrospirota bacterium]